MTLDLSQPRFTQAQVCEMTGLTSASIQTRVNRGQVRPAQQHPGRQAKRLFSGLDIVKLYFIETMSRHNFSSGKAAELAESIAEQTAAWWEGEPELISRAFDVESGQVVDGPLLVSVEAHRETWENYRRLAIYANADGNMEMRAFKLSDDQFWSVECHILPDVYTVIQLHVIITKIINRILRFVYEEYGEIQSPHRGAGSCRQSEVVKPRIKGA